MTVARVVISMMINQEEADQDVADEISEKVDSRNEVMHSDKNDWYF